MRLYVLFKGKPQKIWASFDEDQVIENQRNMVLEDHAMYTRAEIEIELPKEFEQILYSAALLGVHDWNTVGTVLNSDTDKAWAILIDNIDTDTMVKIREAPKR